MTISTLKVDQLTNQDESATVTVAEIRAHLDGGDDASTYQNVVVMTSFQALRDTAPQFEGQIAYMRQWSSTSGRGAGFFTGYLSTGTDDGGTIASNTGWRWVRILPTDNGAINPDWWGTVANGTTSNNAQFTAAIAYAVANGKPVRIPAGDYAFASSILLSSTVTIEGMGQDRTILRFASNLTGWTVSPAVNGVRIAHMSIYSTGTTRTSGTRGIYANGGNLSTGSIGFLDLEDLHIVGFANGFNLQYCQLGRIHECVAEFCEIGYYSKLCVNNRVYSNKFNNNYSQSILLDGDSASVSFSCGTLISNNEIINGGYNAQSSILIQYNEHFTIINNMIDAPQTTALNAVHCIGTSRGTISSNWIGAHPAAGVRLENCQAIMVADNNILSHGAEGVSLLGTTTGCVINGNIMEANTGSDILAGGTSNLNTITNNQCRSTTPTYSYAESASGKWNIVTGNMFNQAQTYDTVNIVFANNHTY